MNIVLRAFLYFILSLNIFAQTGFPALTLKADTLIRTALRDSSGYKLLGELCKIGPRLSGSDNSVKAAEFCRDAMIRLGYDSAWLQPVMVPRWVRGNQETAVLYSSKKKIKQLSVASLGGSVGTSGKLSAKVIEVGSYDELKARASEAAGKIVFYNVKFDQGVENSFQGYGKTAGYRVTGGIEAAKYGAKGFILRSITTRNDNTPHTGITYYNDTIPKIPGLAIGIQDADYLSVRLKTDKNISLTLEMNCFNGQDAPSFNVIGEMRGIEFPDEILTVSGHLDSWDKGDGSHDDGAGCVQSIEIPELLNRTGYHPKRTVRCVLFMNEENGSRGADGYAKYILNDGKQHLLAIESDRGAFTPRGFTVERDTVLIQKLQKYLPLFRKAGIEWIEKGGSGADISHLKNVNALMGYVPDSQRYFDYHHSANDVFSEVNQREFELGTAAMALMVMICDSEDLIK